jgi:hypothetical protein
MKPPRLLSGEALGAAAMATGLALWAISALGLDPTNVPQRDDLLQFHFPAIQRFAHSSFIEALNDYPAAPFPLFYIVGGAIYAALGTLLPVQVFTVCLAAGAVALAYWHAVDQRHHSNASAMSLASAMLISPYLRGQSVYANGDMLALFFAVAAIATFGGQRPSHTRAFAALALAALAVYTRQFYLFLPVALFIRVVTEASWRVRIAFVIYCGALAIPVIALVAFWGGVTPPRFREHLSLDKLGASAPAIILMMAFYATPLVLVTVLRCRGAFLKDIRSPAFWLALVPFTALSAYLISDPESVRNVTGGGMPIHFLQSLPLSGVAKGLMVAGGVLLGSAYLVYLVRQDLRANLVVPLIALCFFPTSILYQRYFDPLLLVLYATTIRTRESLKLGTTSLAILLPAFELFVGVTGFIHYS